MDNNPEVKLTAVKLSKTQNMHIWQQEQVKQHFPQRGINILSCDVVRHAEGLTSLSLLSVPFFHLLEGWRMLKLSEELAGGCTDPPSRFKPWQWMLHLAGCSGLLGNIQCSAGSEIHASEPARRFHNRPAGKDLGSMWKLRGLKGLVGWRSWGKRG